MQGAEKLLDRPFTRDRSADAKISAAVPGSILEGLVTGNLLPHNLIQVRIMGLEHDVNCLWAAGIISGLLGFKTSFIPPIKTRVLVYYTGQEHSFVIGSLPTTSIDPADLPRHLTGPDTPSYHASEVYQQRLTGGTPMYADHKPPMDLAEGELMIGNLMGVAVTLLRHMAALSAGDLARVETHLMDDMVRIISGVFRHHSAFGDHRIYNDGGRLNVEYHGAAYDYEAYGNLKNEDAKAKMLKPDQPDLGEDSQIDGYTDEGRWRLSQYVGWLGDFLNVWVTDPVQALGRLASDQLRGGKFRCHVNVDGSCLVQSVSEICLEKVVRIPVPVRFRRETDPEGNRSDSDVRNKDFLKQWSPSGNLFEMAFQLREYSRWLSNTWSLARFRQMNLDFEVPTEAATPPPMPNSDQQDRLSVNRVSNQEAVSWRTVYACMRILRDGSLMMVDGYGNSILTTQTGVQISSTRDIQIEAAGSVNIVAGRDINLVAKKNLNLTAVEEVLRAQAGGAIQMLSKAGRVIMDFLSAGWLVLRNGSVNVNGAVSLDGQTGDVQASGALTARQVSAAITNGPFGEQSHMFHIFQGTPSPQELDAEDEFKYQPDYATGDLYQSHTQQALERNEQVSAGSWSMAGNAVDGKGAPWPGESPQVKKPAGGSNLNVPAAEVQSNQPAAMTSSAMVLKTQ